MLIPGEGEHGGTGQSLAVRAPACPGRQGVVAVMLLLEEAARLLCQLAHVTGRVMLPPATVTPLFRPHLGPGHLIAPCSKGSPPPGTPANSARQPPLRDGPRLTASQPARTPSPGTRQGHGRSMRPNVRGRGKVSEGGPSRTRTGDDYVLCSTRPRAGQALPVATIALA